MSELKRYFAALGFTSMPDSTTEVIERASAMMEKHKDSTETDRLARQAIRENRSLCLEYMEEKAREQE